MTNGSRCCLHESMRIVNLITNLCGIGMIVYSLWLEKVWVDGVHQFSSVSHIPKPWFIYTCLGVGIAVCLSTIFGHMVANWMDNLILCVYIFSICSLLFLEIAVIVTILFKIDWSKLALSQGLEATRLYGILPSPFWWSLALLYYRLRLSYKLATNVGIYTEQVVNKEASLCA